MHLWNVDRLADELRDGRVTNAERFQYALAAMLLQALLTHPGLIGSALTVTTVILFGAALAVSVRGLVRAFRANERGDGRDFLERYFCLAVPLSVRLTALWAPLYLAGLAMRRLGAPGSALGVLGAWLPALVNVALLVLFYRWLARAIARAAAAPVA